MSTLPPHTPWRKFYHAQLQMPPQIGQAPNLGCLAFWETGKPSGTSERIGIESGRHPGSRDRLDASSTHL